MTIKGIKKDKVIVKQFNSEVGSSIYRHEFSVSTDDIFILYSTDADPYPYEAPEDYFAGKNKYGLLISRHMRATICRIWYAEGEGTYDNFALKYQYFDSDTQSDQEGRFETDLGPDQDVVTEVPYPFM